MRFRVVRTHLRGVPLSRKELAATPGAVGQLLTVTATDDRYRGVLTVAKLQDEAGSGKATSDELLPCLYAPVLLILSINGMLISGYERIADGDQERDFVQGWWARLP